MLHIFHRIYKKQKYYLKSIKILSSFEIQSQCEKESIWKDRKNLYGVKNKFLFL